MLTLSTRLSKGRPYDATLSSIQEMHACSLPTSQSPTIQSPLSVFTLHSRAIPSQAARTSSLFVPLPALIDPKHTTRHDRQANQIAQPKRLGLKHTLQRWEIDHERLTHQTARDSEVEHAIALGTPELDFAAQDGFRGTPACERVEHVEEDESGEGERGVAGRDLMSGEVGGREVRDVSVERAGDDDEGGLEDATEETGSQDAGVAWARGQVQKGLVDGFDAKGLGWGAVHEDVCGYVSGEAQGRDKSGDLLIQRICIALRGLRYPKALLSMTRRSAAAEVLS